MKQYIKHKWRQDTFIKNAYISTDLSVFFRVNEEKLLYKMSTTPLKYDSARYDFNRK